MSYRKTKVGRRWAAAALILGVFCSARGAVLQRPLQFQTLTSKDGLSSDMVLSLAVQDDRVWFGTYAGGATLYDPARRTFQAYTTKGEPQDKKDNGNSINWQNLLAYNHVSAIRTDGDRVWFGTNFYGFGGGGISCYRPKGKVVWKRYSTYDRRAKKVIALAVEPKGIWVGTERGLSFLEKTSEQWTQFYSVQNGLAGNFVNAILLEADALWAGTNAGISRRAQGRTAWKNYGSKDGLTDLDIKALARVSGRIWAGTSGGLLFSYEQATDRWAGVEVPASLPRGGVNGLAVRGGLAFICRDDGMDIYDSAAGRWDGLTVADGLPSNTVLCAFPTAEGVWFGTDQGAAFLHLPTQK